MLLPIKPICSVSKMRRDGTSLIFIQYCQSAENKTLLNTEIAIPPNYWNKKLERISDNLPTAFGIANNLNKEIRVKIAWLKILFLAPWLIKFLILYVKELKQKVNGAVKKR